MEKHIKYFIETHIDILTHDKSHIEIDESGKEDTAFGTDAVEVEAVGYFCNYCKTKLDFTELSKLEEHVLTHLSLREYFVYARKTFRVRAKSEAQAMKQIAEKKSVHFKIGDFKLSSELTDEDNECVECGEFYADRLLTYDKGHNYCEECYKVLADELKTLPDEYKKTVPVDGDYTIVEGIDSIEVFQLGKRLPFRLNICRRVACLEIKVHMDTKGYYPNVWLQRERGGYDLLDLEKESSE